MITSRLGSFEGLRAADIFAGTGALGIEALSRGAAHCMFVETDRKTISALRRNIEAFGAASQAKILTQPAPRLARIDRPVRLVFLDAPYRRGLTEPTMEALRHLGWADTGCLAVVETASDEIPNASGWNMFAERVYGAARISLFTADIGA